MPGYRHVLAFALVVVSSAIASAIAGEPADQSPQADGSDEAAYVAYYWRVKPGKLEEYNAYIKGTAERIDEDARKAGVFVEVTTVLPAPSTEGPAPDWTHLRIFKLKDMAAVEGLGPGLDAATLRVVPDEAQRKANSAAAAEMRDFVRREVWTRLR